MSTTTIDNTEIKYDRITKDFAILVDGVAVAYGRNYSDAEAKRTAYLADRDAEGLAATATELDGGAVECSEPDNHCAVHNPCPAHAADAARYLAEQSYGLGAIVEHLAYGTGTVIAITDDEYLNVQVKFNQVSRFGRKFWFDRSELHIITTESPEPSIEAIAAHMTSVHMPNWQPAGIDDADLPF